MLVQLIDLLKEGVGIGHIGSILNTVDDLIGLFTSDYVKDGNSKDAMIDAIIELLKINKSK